MPYVDAHGRCMSRPVFHRFCNARSRVPIVLGPFHYCAFGKRAAPDAPETIDDHRRCTGVNHPTSLVRVARERVPTIASAPPNQIVKTKGVFVAQTVILDSNVRP